MAFRRRIDGPEPDLADTVLRIAVLLQAGATPGSAWFHLAETGNPAAARIHAALTRTADLPAAIASAAPRMHPRSRRRDGEAVDASWTDVAASWEIATTVGAPLAATLRAISSAIRDASELRDDVAVTLAEPRATGRLMTWLPAFGLLIGIALGFDTLVVLTTTAPGLVILAVGVTLMAAARAWTTRLVHAAQPPPGTPGAVAELMAVALSGGVSIERARHLLHDAPGGPRDVGECDDVLQLSTAAGVPAVELLRASAAHARHQARIAGKMRAAKLGARLLLPLGVCTLPAFLCLGVAPLMLSIMAGTQILE